LAYGKNQVTDTEVSGGREGRRTEKLNTRESLVLLVLIGRGCDGLQRSLIAMGCNDRGCDGLQRSLIATGCNDRDRGS
jgi:hypothetical protein